MVTRSQPSKTSTTSVVDYNNSIDNTYTDDARINMSKIVNFAVVVAVSLATFNGNISFRNVEAFQQQQKRQQRQWMPMKTPTATKKETTQLQLQRLHRVIQPGTTTTTTTSSSHNRRFRRHRAISVPFNAATNPTPPRSPFSSSSNQEPNEPTSSSSWDDIFATTAAASTNNHSGMVGRQQQLQQLQKHDELTVVDKSIIAGCATFVVTAFTTILRVSEPGSWRYFLAGGICAMVSHAIPTPIDVIKVRTPIEAPRKKKGGPTNNVYVESLFPPFVFFLDGWCFVCVCVCVCVCLLAIVSLTYHSITYDLVDDMKL